MTPGEFLAYLKKQPYYREQLVHIERIPARRARYGKLEKGLPRALVFALKANGTTRVYSHQAQAINAIRRGAHVVVATGTASGKTLCYNIPVLEAILTSPSTRALYLFPTKALAHDQLKNLTNLTAPITPQPKIGAYDGDTPQRMRASLRAEASIVFTNPDMLHVGILPNHDRWATFLKHLRYVVLDEAHVYRGVFGSHLAVILRRLNRLCEYYGSVPQYIAASATISNPGEHVARLTGRTPLVIDNDGAPRAPKIFALWNPPLSKDNPPKRRSPYREAAALFAAMARAKIRNITFTKARVVAELILKYARTSLSQTDPNLLNRIAAYRAGYLVDHRRALENALQHGSLIGVAATNALELGVDVGGLDAVVSVGYPGTVASFWQQAGRAGRRGGRGQKAASLAMLVARDDPLDQYFMRHPAALFERPHEHALIDPHNFHVLLPHLSCAAEELPLTPQDELRFGEGFVPAMIELEKEGTLVYQAEADNWIYIGRSHPARRINIRSMDRNPITLVNAHTGEKLEVMDASLAPSRIHPGAIYMHNGESYRVKALNFTAKEASLVPVSVDYYTQTREINQVQVIKPLRRRVLRRTVIYWGAVKITQRVIAYRKIRHLTDSRSKEIELDLPPHAYQTRALWWRMPRPWQKATARRGYSFSGGLHAIQHAITGILPLFAMCDQWDIGGHTSVSAPDTGEAQLFLYDAYPGGVGISEQGFLLMQELWRATLANIKECPCEAGCPSCIYSSKAGDSNKYLDKSAAIWILEALLQ